MPPDPLNTLENTVNYAALIMRYSGSGQWDRSLDAAKEWLSKDPESPAAFRAAATALVNLTRYEEAEPYIASALERRPEDDFVLRLASIAHFNGRRPAAADTAIHKAISLNPEDSGHWRHLAWMCYSQGDRKAGLKWALKARELSPRDPGALNLIALCQPKDREGQEARRQYLLEALELRPNDPNLQNNLGVQYLNEPRDYAAAEACFRRSLRVNPTSALYRKNLFLAIKGRDWIYKALCAPRDLVYRFVRAVRPTGWKRYALLPALIVLWLVIGRYLYAVLILWAIFAWPMIKVYEYLTLGDLKKKAGEIGALRGGFMGYRSWSLRTRLGIFAIILAGFWTGMIFAFRAAAGGNPKATFTLLGAAIAVLIGFVVALIRRRKGMLRNPLHSWQRNKKFNKILRNPT